MYCNYCGKFRDGGEFCPYCGKKINKKKEVDTFSDIASAGGFDTFSPGKIVKVENVQTSNPSDWRIKATVFWGILAGLMISIFLLLNGIDSNSISDKIAKIFPPKETIQESNNVSDDISNKIYREENMAPYNEPIVAFSRNTNNTSSRKNTERALETPAPRKTKTDRQSNNSSQSSSSSRSSTSSPSSTSSTNSRSSTGSYVLNTNSRKFHLPGCGSVKTMAEHNKSYVNMSRSEVISAGYSPCGNCNP